jgi:ComF family protein
VKYLGQIRDFNPSEIDWLVPVPLHHQRLKQRGYNQAELLSGVIGHYLELPVITALKRVKNTHPQFDLPREKRFSNIRAAFDASKEVDLSGKRLLLVDDIYTTGATVNECCRALLLAGARSVNIFTLARAVEFC